MSLSFFVVLFYVSSAAAALTPVSASSANPWESSYQKALLDPEAKDSCLSFQTLAQNKEFPLHKLARIRHAQFCQKQPVWSEIEEDTKDTLYKKFYVQAWFESLIEDKNFGFAYLLYQDNRDLIDLDKKEFENLALKAKKSSLTKDQKKALQKDLERIAPRFIINPKKKDLSKVALDYRRDRQFEKALVTYRKIINDPSFSLTERWKAFRGARTTYKLERWSRMESYIKSSRQWAQFLRSEKHYLRSPYLTKLHHDANIEYIRTLWTEKGQTSAQSELAKLEKELSGRHSLQLVYWLKGRMSEERGQYQEAVDWLKKAASEKPISEQDRERVLWALAWNQRRIKDFEASMANMAKLHDSSELTFFGKTKYHYWEAENLESMGKSKQAKQAFTELAEMDLYGYYGALAYRKLNQPFPPVPNNQLNPKDSLSLLKKDDRKLFSTLVRVGEHEVAEELVLQRLKTERSWSVNEWVSYFDLLHRAQAFKRFFSLYHALPPEKQSDILKQYPQLLFPQPYAKEVVASAQNNLVSASLIYSIMKQESGFDVKARSHADAFGLLQLIPEVAAQAAARMPSVSYEKPRDLFQPNVIIPLGANNLKHLFSKFDSNFILSVASYNANEKAVMGWVKSRWQGDPVTFIEDIPYEETKGYVKLVMRNYIAYNRFAAPKEPFTFPEVCLQGVESFTTK